MRIAHTLSELRDALSGYRHPAFVPTMGNLHDGHIALVEQAKPLGDVTVTSIFVNRLQFLPHEDFDTYPRTWERDCEQLRIAGCDVLFAPRETRACMAQFSIAPRSRTRPPVSLTSSDMARSTL